MSCNLETEMSVIDWISAFIISGTICVLVRKSKVLKYVMLPTTLFVYLLCEYSFNFIEQYNKIDNELWKLFEVHIRVCIHILLHEFILRKRYYIKGTYIRDKFTKKSCLTHFKPVLHFCTP